MQRVRQILPPPRLLMLAVTVYALLWLPLLWLRHLGLPAEAESFRAPAVFTLFICALYGVYRAAAFHPMWRPGYLAWLRTTPWTVERPLPEGPVLLVWEDAIPLGALTLAVWVCQQESCLEAPLIALCGYLAGVTLTLTARNVARFAWLVLFLVALGLRFYADVEVALALVCVAVVVGRAGLNRSLASFPWQNSDSRNGGASDASLASALAVGLSDKHQRAKVSERTGWPYESLGPEKARPALSGENRTLGVLFTAWACYLILSSVTDEAERLESAHSIVTITLLLGPLGRLFVYRFGHAPPISFWGRLRTRRWLIPGYDFMFVTPLTAALAGCLCFWGLTTWGVPPQVHAPIVVTITLLILFFGGPTLRNWHFTGHHRIAPPLANSQMVQV